MAAAAESNLPLNALLHPSESSIGSPRRRYHLTVNVNDYRTVQKALQPSPPSLMNRQLASWRRRDLRRSSDEGNRIAACGKQKPWDNH